MVFSAFLFANHTEAQFRISVHSNNNGQGWGSAGNYQSAYYYLPEIDTYYDIPQRRFIYFNGSNWISDTQLPYAYSNYDLNNGYKVAINEPRPYLHADRYRQQYSQYYNAYQRRIGGIGSAQNYPGYPDYRYDNGRRPNQRYENNRYNNNDRFKRGRENQNFDNKRNENGNNERFNNRGNVFGNYGYQKNRGIFGKGTRRGNNERDEEDDDDEDEDD